MGNIVNLIIQLVSGGVGGLAAGKLFPKLSLGTLLDIIAGLVGGVGVGQLLNFFGVGLSTGGLNVTSILLNILISLIGGVAVMAIVAGIKKLVTKK